MQDLYIYIFIELKFFLHIYKFNIVVFVRFIVEKCDGDLRIENRKKTDMVKELVRRGYNSDPVKAWKLIQDRESVLVNNTFLLY